MNDFDTEKAVREYLPGILHMSLGTSANGKPWVCEVHFSYDEDLNLYFRSKLATRHCQEMAANPNVAGNIVVQHGMTDKPRGIYFEGQAELLENLDENSAAYKAVSTRYNLGLEILEDASQPLGHKFYKISVTDFYVFDARESKPSTKYHLPWRSKS